MKKFIALVLIAAVVACTQKMAPTPTDALIPVRADARRASAKWPGITLDDLIQGKALYEQNCVRCHDLKKPKSQDEEGWNSIMPKMARKAKIDSKTQDLILKYVVTLSGRS